MPSSEGRASYMVAAARPDAPGPAVDRGSAAVRVEVAYALPQRQKCVPLMVRPGTTVEEAIRASRLLDEFPDIDLHACPIGIFGQRVSLDTRLMADDRVEIYRPLKRDPKDRRRGRARLKAGQGR